MCFTWEFTQDSHQNVQKARFTCDFLMFSPMKFHILNFTSFMDTHYIPKQADGARFITNRILFYICVYISLPLLKQKK